MFKSLLRSQDYDSAKVNNIDLKVAKMLAGCDPFGIENKLSLSIRFSSISVTRLHKLSSVSNLLVLQYYK